MGFSRSLKTDAEYPPFRPLLPSWNFHVGGLPWPEKLTAREIKKVAQPAGN
jgi:hypothetical protein